MNEITFEFATQDDCLEKMVPSDLRRVISDRDDARMRLADAERLLNEMSSIAHTVFKPYLKKGEEFLESELNAREKEWTPKIGEQWIALGVYTVTIKGKDGDVFICKHRAVDGISNYHGYTLKQLQPKKG